MLTLYMSASLKNKTFVDLGGSVAEQVISLGYPAMLHINLNSFPDPCANVAVVHSGTSLATFNGMWYAFSRIPNARAS